MGKQVLNPYGPRCRMPATKQRCRPRRVSLLRLTLIIFSVLGAVASAQELTYAAIRLPALTVTSGTELMVEVDLLNASGQAVPAPEDYPFLLEVRRGSREGDLVAAYELHMPAGSSTATVAVTIHETGIMSLRALNANVSARETFLRVASPEAGSGPNQRVETGLGWMGPGWIGPGWIGPGWMGLAYAAPSSPSGVSTAYQLEILYDAESPYLANGSDSAQISIFLYDEEGQPTRAQEDIEVRLVTSKGVLKPKEVVIPKGHDGVTVQLSARRPGKVTLNYRGAIPRATLMTLELPPITFSPNLLYITASPSQTSLLQPLELVIRLYDANGQPVSMRANRMFTVEIANGSKGRGVFKPAAQATIEKGGFEARINFVPNWVGRVLVSASTPNLQSSTVEIQVAMAFIWILLSAVGGALGSVLALLFGPKLPVAKRYARIFVGVIAGFTFFWALIYGVLAVPSADLVLLNPISAVVVSVLGGYAGASIFTLLLKSFGVSVPQA